RLTGLERDDAGGRTERVVQGAHDARVVGAQSGLVQLLQEPPLPDHVAAVGVQRTEQRLNVEVGHTPDPVRSVFPPESPAVTTTSKPRTERQPPSRRVDDRLLDK